VAKQVSDVRVILQINVATGNVTVLNTYVTQESTDPTLQGNGALDQEAVTPTQLADPLQTFVNGLIAQAQADAGV